MLDSHIQYCTLSLSGVFDVRNPFAIDINISLFQPEKRPTLTESTRAKSTLEVAHHMAEDENEESKKEKETTLSTDESELTLL